MSLITEALGKARVEASRQIRDAPAKRSDQTITGRDLSTSPAPAIVATTLVILLAAASIAFIANFGGGLSMTRGAAAKAEATTLPPDAAAQPIGSATTAANPSPESDPA